ncbi:MAG: ABC transporter permease [Planctomycetes bacterium]|nr:ABC transporter permease [Planctomycetota bacterium]
MRNSACRVLGDAGALTAALIGSLFVAAIVLVVAGYDAPLALRDLVLFPLSNAYQIGNVLVNATPLLLLGLAAVVAFRVGFFNIGAEGQYLVGAVAGATPVILMPSLPGIVAVPLLLVAGAAGGSAWCLVAGILRERRGVPEVISTLMLNFVALYLLAWVVNGPLQEISDTGLKKPQSAPIAEAAELLRLAGGGSRLHVGVIFALAAALAAHVYLFRTSRGLELRVVGQNPNAAEFVRIRPDRARLEAAAISGALAGLAGAVDVGGVHYRLFADLSQGKGYTAIAVALLGATHPLGVIPAAIFFGYLAVGSSAMERGDAHVPSVMVFVLQATLIVASVAAEAWRRRRSRFA